MTRGRIMILLCAVALATGCAGSATQSKIVPTGHGTLVIRGDFLGTSSDSTDKARALARAATYCRERGEEIQTIPTSENGSGFLEIAAPLIEFRCVAPVTR